MSNNTDGDENDIVAINKKNNKKNVNSMHDYNIFR